mgnify:CR=1 FL=1
MSLLDKLLDKLTDHWEKKCQREMDGIPLMWVLYQPQNPIPNILFRPHPMFTGDEYLNTLCKEMARHMRETYPELRDGGSP